MDRRLTDDLELSDEDEDKRLTIVL